LFPYPYKEEGLNTDSVNDVDDAINQKLHNIFNENYKKYTSEVDIHRDDLKKLLNDLRTVKKSVIEKVEKLLKNKEIYNKNMQDFDFLIDQIENKIRNKETTLETQEYQSIYAEFLKGTNLFNFNIAQKDETTFDELRKNNETPLVIKAKELNKQKRIEKDLVESVVESELTKNIKQLNKQKKDKYQNYPKKILKICKIY